jgi:hypothetical protein
MKYFFKIGEHEVEVEKGLFGQITVLVDGREELRERILFRQPIKFKAGNRTIELRLAPFGRVRCLVDGERVKGRAFPTARDAISSTVLLLLIACFLSALAGYMLAYSERTDQTADLLNGWADSLAPFTNTENLRAEAADLRAEAREAHDYSVYLLAFALLLVAIVVACQAYAFRETVE